MGLKFSRRCQRVMLLLVCGKVRMVKMSQGDPGEIRDPRRAGEGTAETIRSRRRGWALKLCEMEAATMKRIREDKSAQGRKKKKRREDRSNKSLRITRT